MAKAIPDGFHTLTPHLACKDSARAIEFYKKAFGAEELGRFPGPDGKGVMHATLRLGSSMLFLSDAMPGMGAQTPESLKGFTGSLQLNVENVDAAFKRAVDAGAKVAMPVSDMFWGDRYGQVIDTEGHLWSISTHKEDVSNEELAKRGQAFFAQMAQQQKK